MSEVQERTESDLESEWEEEESDPTWDPLEGIRPRVKEEPEEEEADPEWVEGQEGSSSPPLSLSVSAHAAVKEEVGEDGGADSEYEQVLEETECKRWVLFSLGSWFRFLDGLLIVLYHVKLLHWCPCSS